MNSVWKNVNGTWFQPIDVQVIHAAEYNRYDEIWEFRVVVAGCDVRPTHIRWSDKDKDVITNLYNEVVSIVVGEQK